MDHILKNSPDGTQVLIAALDDAMAAAEVARAAALDAEAKVSDAHARLRDHLHASTTRETKLLTATEAAERLPGKALRPDGTPRDSVYTLLRRIGGRKHEGKWFIAEDVFESYIRKGAA